MARRLLINILLGNGDAHFKNWTLIYRDRISLDYHLYMMLYLQNPISMKIS